MKGDLDTHGKMSTRAEWRHSRECAAHGQHGPLYNCPDYPPRVQKEITEARAKYRSNLRDPVWIEKQVANGVPPHVIDMFKAMAGVSK